MYPLAKVIGGFLFVCLTAVLVSKAGLWLLNLVVSK